MVFAKADAANLASLVKQLDKLVADKKDAKLFAVVNLVAEKPDDLKEEAKKFVEKNELKNVALTVTKPESAKGWKINADADVTVMVYKDKKVTANHAAKSGGIDKKLIEAVLADASKATE
jgi:hypothetical protein